MQTIKLKYETTDEVRALILDYQRQYSSCLHFMYNRVMESSYQISEHELRKLSKSLNNFSLIDTYLMQCVIREAKQIYKTREAMEFNEYSKKFKKLSKEEIQKLKDDFEYHRYRVIFGGKKNFEKRCKNQVSKEEWSIMKLNPLYVMGDAINKGNRKFQINDDLESITWKPIAKTKYQLKLIGTNKRIQILKKLYKRQLSKDLSITYKIDQNYIYISFEEDELYDKKLNYGKVSNRVLGIDMNPNYIGWSIVDWKSESEFDIIDSGVYSLLELNNLTKEYKKLNLPSTAKERIWLNNKRLFETVEIVKNIINKAIHYNVLIISIEDLDMKSEDKDKGKDYNELCNNKWLRNTFVNNITKRCKIFGIQLLKVQTAYSSFIGNFLYRSYKLPDMILASIEIGRRAYEFYNQYIIKSKNTKKNIIRPNLTEFKELYYKSLEEFGLESGFKDLISVYEYFKKSKLRYRLSINSFNLLSYRFSSKKSLISVI